MAGQQMMAMNPLNQPGQQLVLPAPAAPAVPAPAMAASAPQPLPVPIIVRHSNQYKPVAIMSAGESMEMVDRYDKMEK